MAAGRPRKNPEQGEAMNEEELKAMEERTKDVRSPIHEADYSLPKPAKVFQTPDGRNIQQFGKASAAPKVGHQGTLKAFARIEIDHENEGWIPMTAEESLEYQDKGLLVGYDADKELGLIKPQKRGKHEKATVSSSADLG